MQNVVAVIVLRLDRLGVLPPAGRRSRARLTFNRDALLILGMIGGVVATELLRAGLRGRGATATSRARSSSNALGRPAADALGRRSSRPASRVLWWAHIALVAAFLCYLPFSKHLHIATTFPNIYFRKLAPRGELPKMDLEDEDATFGLKTLQDLGWKDLLDGFTCTECGRCQEACPAWNTGKPLNPKHIHHGHPGHVGGGRARDRPHPELADRARDLRPRRHDGLGGGAGQADRRQRDPVRRGLGLRDLRRVRRGLPGAHRARRQDRRAAPEPRPRGEPLPEPS